MNYHQQYRYYIKFPYERLSCRRSGSNFGTWNEIRDACAAEPFVDEAAQSDDCTGSATSRYRTCCNFIILFYLTNYPDFQSD